MKVCIIGDFTDYLDEGLKNISHYTANNLSEVSNVDLLKVNVKNIVKLSSLREIRSFHPDIIHYVPGPTNKSIILLKFILVNLKYDPKIVLSAPHPKFNDITFKLLNLTPSCVFTSSKELRKRMETLGISSCSLSNGVDIQKFIPVSDIEKSKLMKKYGIVNHSFTILHVGHLMAKRNLEIFIKLSKEYQVVIVASNYIKTDYKLFKKLRNAGCIIFQGYFPNIEEFYQMSDCYLFNVKPGNSILSPLSIMEAMSCNLPVITTKFKGITTLFKEGEGLIFTEKEEDLFEAIKRIQKKDTSVSTRKKVEHYSWQNITKEIVKIYEDLLYNGKGKA